MFAFRRDESFRRSFPPIHVKVSTARTIQIGQAALTQREHEVLVLLVEGDTNREIARKLGIHEQTVKDHVSALCRKFHVRRRVVLAVAAIRAGL
jgi:two-component system nitrate/nitrite response regulator NarL